MELRRIDLFTENTYQNRNKTNRYRKLWYQQKTRNKSRTKTKNGTIRNKTEKTRKPSKQSSKHDTDTEISWIKCKLYEMRKNGHYACRRKFNNNRTVKRLTEEKANELKEYTSESMWSVEVKPFHID